MASEANIVGEIVGLDGNVTEGNLIDVGPVATPVQAQEEFDPLEFASYIVESEPSSSGLSPEPEAKSKDDAMTEVLTKVGGVDYCVGGWGQYEADRRRARWETDKNVWKTVYAGRSYIGGSDAARSLLASGPAGRPLDAALARLACSLRTLESAACKDWEGGAAAPVALPALTAEDVETFMRDPNPDPEEIDSFLADVAEIGVGTEKPALPALPPLPARVVKTEDAEGLAGLEEAAGPWVQAAEEHRARAASFVDAVAAALGEKTRPAADSGEPAGSL